MQSHPYNSWTWILLLPVIINEDIVVIELGNIKEVYLDLQGRDCYRRVLGGNLVTLHIVLEACEKINANFSLYYPIVRSLSSAFSSMYPQEHLVPVPEDISCDKLPYERRHIYRLKLILSNNLTRYT